jgi:hypothetical protein
VYVYLRGCICIFRGCVYTIPLRIRAIGIYFCGILTLQGYRGPWREELIWREEVAWREEPPRSRLGNVPS